MTMWEAILNYREWVAFIAGALIVAVLSAALFKIFRGQSAEEAEAESPDTANIEYMDNVGHLRASMHLAELKAKEITIAVEAVERKAVQLIALCITLLGYVAAYDIGLHWHELLRIPASLFLAISAIYCFKAADLRTHGLMGLTPIVSAFFAKYAPGQATQGTLRHALNNYMPIIKKGHETQADKAEDLGKAKRWLLWGVAFYLGWILSENLFRALNKASKAALDEQQCLIGVSAVLV